MKVDVKFSNAKVYDVSVFDVAKGEKFSLLTDYTDVSSWFANNDSVLSVTQNDNNADVEATGTGTSIILIKSQNLDAPTLKQLTINVLDAIVDPASNLNVSGGIPIPK